MQSILEEIAQERQRQMSAEGWTHEHDDRHLDGQLAKAAACYAYAATVPEIVREVDQMRAGEQSQIAVIARCWPWTWGCWKPKDRRRDCVRAAALLVAEIERIDRIAEALGS